MGPHTGSRVVRISTFPFLAGCHKKWLNQGCVVLCSSQLCQDFLCFRCMCYFCFFIFGCHCNQLPRKSRLWNDRLTLLKLAVLFWCTHCVVEVQIFWVTSLFFYRWYFLYMEQLDLLIFWGAVVCVFQYQIMLSGSVDLNHLNLHIE